MKILLATAILSLSFTAHAIIYQWTPSGPEWQQGGDATLSSGFIEFVDPSPLDAGWVGYTMASVVDFAFTYGGVVPAFSTINRMWNLYSDGFGIKLTSPMGNAGFTCGADDWVLTMGFDSLSHPFGNAWAEVRNANGEVPILNGRWLRVNNVPDAGGTLGFLALSLAGLLVRRHVE